MRWLSSYLLETFSYGFAFGFITGFVEQSKHVAFVCFYAGLVEGIDVEDITADTACFLEEVNELSQIAFRESGYLYFYVRYTAIDVGYLRTEFGHFVDFVDAFACKVVESVEVIGVGGAFDLLLHFLVGGDRLEEGGVAPLSPMTPWGGGWCGT